MVLRVSGASTGSSGASTSSSRGSTGAVLVRVVLAGQNGSFLKAGLVQNHHF